MPGRGSRPDGQSVAEAEIHLREVSATAGSKTIVRPARLRENRHVSQEANETDWRRLPRGIGMGILFAVPFWVVLILWLIL